MLYNVVVFCGDIVRLWFRCFQTVVMRTEKVFLIWNLFLSYFQDFSTCSEVPAQLSQRNQLCVNVCVLAQTHLREYMFYYYVLCVHPQAISKKQELSPNDRNSFRSEQECHVL